MPIYGFLDTPEYADIVKMMTSVLSVVHSDFDGVFAYDKVSELFLEFEDVNHAKQVNNDSFVIYSKGVIYTKYSKNDYCESAYTKTPWDLYNELTARKRSLLTSDKGISVYTDMIHFDEYTVFAPDNITFISANLFIKYGTTKTLQINYTNGEKTKCADVEVHPNMQEYVDSLDKKFDFKV